MADNQPDNTPAPGPSGAQPPAPAPGADPAENNQPAPQLTLESFDENAQAYLKSQGVTDFSSPDAIKKVVNHAMTSQQTAAKLKTDLDKVKQTVSPTPTPANPFATPGSQPSATPDNNPTGPSGPAQPQPAAQPTGGLDSLQAFTLANQLVGIYPELAEDLQSGKFYQDMQGMGIPLTLADGQVNIAGITTYGKNVQTQKQYEAKIAELEKPNENNIPDAAPTTPQQPADDAPMTKQMALAIGMHTASGNTHPRQQEAIDFLQKNPS